MSSDSSSFQFKTYTAEKVEEFKKDVPSANDDIRSGCCDVDRADNAKAGEEGSFLGGGGYSTVHQCTDKGYAWKEEKKYRKHSQPYKYQMDENVNFVRQLRANNESVLDLRACGGRNEKFYMRNLPKESLGTTILENAEKTIYTWISGQLADPPPKIDKERYYTDLNGTFTTPFYYNKDELDKFWKNAAEKQDDGPIHQLLLGFLVTGYVHAALDSVMGTVKKIALEDKVVLMDLKPANCFLFLTKAPEAPFDLGKWCEGNRVKNKKAAEIMDSFRDLFAFETIFIDIDKKFNWNLEIIENATEKTDIIRADKINKPKAIEALQKLAETYTFIMFLVRGMKFLRQMTQSAIKLYLRSDRLPTDALIGHFLAFLNNQVTQKKRDSWNASDSLYQMFSVLGKYIVEKDGSSKEQLKTTVEKTIKKLFEKEQNRELDVEGMLKSEQPGTNKYINALKLETDVFM